MTAALAVLLETPAPAEAPAALAPAPAAEAVPEPIGVAGPDGAIVDGSSSGAEIALCEVEILEASGPIRKLAEPPPLPRAAEGAEAATHRGPACAGVDLLRARGAIGDGGARLAADGAGAFARGRAIRARARRRALRPRSRAARRGPLRRSARRVGEGARARARQPRLPGERGTAAR